MAASTPPPPTGAHGKTPVVIITGFLGAGKTTLMNHILRNQSGVRVGVLVNEFGTIDIDSELIDDSARSSVAGSLSLKNGCVCCTVNDDLQAALKKLVGTTGISGAAKEGKVPSGADAAGAGSGKAAVDTDAAIGAHTAPLDYILLETSGVADPAPVVYTVEHGELGESLFVDSVVTVVAADEFEAGASGGDGGVMATKTAQLQLAHADVIVLNKVDLIDDADAKRVEETLHTAYGHHSVVRCEHADVPLSLLFGADVTHSTRGGKDVHHDHDHDHDHSHASGGAAHSSHLVDDAFVSLGLRLRGALPLHALQRFMCTALPARVVRVKAVLSLAGREESRLVVHRCGKRYNFEQTPAVTTAAGDDVESQLVLIGQGFDVDALRETFRDVFPPSVAVVVDGEPTPCRGAEPDAELVTRRAAAVEGLGKLVEDDVRFRWHARPGASSRAEAAFGLSGVLGIGYVEDERLSVMNREVAQG